MTGIVTFTGSSVTNINTQHVGSIGATTIVKDADFSVGNTGSLTGSIYVLVVTISDSDIGY